MTFNSQRVTPVAATSLHIHLAQTRDRGHTALPFYQLARGPRSPCSPHTPDPLGYHLAFLEDKRLGWLMSRLKAFLLDKASVVLCRVSYPSAE